MPKASPIPRARKKWEKNWLEILLFFFIAQGISDTEGEAATICPRQLLLLLLLCRMVELRSKCSLVAVVSWL